MRIIVLGALRFEFICYCLGNTCILETHCVLVFLLSLPLLLLFELNLRSWKFKAFVPVPNQFIKTRFSKELSFQVGIISEILHNYQIPKKRLILLKTDISVAVFVKIYSVDDLWKIQVEIVVSTNDFSFWLSNVHQSCFLWSFLDERFQFQSFLLLIWLTYSDTFVVLIFRKTILILKKSKCPAFTGSTGVRGKPKMLPLRGKPAKSVNNRKTESIPQFFPGVKKLSTELHSKFICMFSYDEEHRP